MTVLFKNGKTIEITSKIADSIPELLEKQCNYLINYNEEYEVEKDEEQVSLIIDLKEVVCVY